MEAPSPLVLFGTGELAHLATFYFEKLAGRKVVGYAVEDAYLKEPTCGGKPVWPASEIHRHAPPAEASMFVAVGYRKVNAERRRLYEWARAQGYALASYVHPSSCLYGVEVRDNVLVLEYNVLQLGVVLGANVIMNLHNAVGHGTRIGDHCFFSSHITIGGGTRIGAESFLGMKASIREGISIGERAVLGAGALAMSDVPDKGVLLSSRSKLAPTSSDDVNL